MVVRNGTQRIQKTVLLRNKLIAAALQCINWHRLHKTHISYNFRLVAYIQYIRWETIKKYSRLYYRVTYAYRIQLVLFEIYVNTTTQLTAELWLSVLTFFIVYFREQFLFLF